MHSFQVPWQSPNIGQYTPVFQGSSFLDFLIHAVVSALSDVLFAFLKSAVLRVFLQIWNTRPIKEPNAMIIARDI